MIERISQENLEKILNNDIDQASRCMIKFYSNSCHYCHALKSHYESIAENAPEGVHFLAFNVDDTADDIEGKYGFQGVPSFCFVETGESPTVNFISEPEEPHATTWYALEYIQDFVTKSVAHSQSTVR
tara:strand:+ start:177 stop:560 length:384 start_codon:yes stop_codon:yes gene_type:complete